MARDGYRRRQLYGSLPVRTLRGTDNGCCDEPVWRYNAPGVEKHSTVTGVVSGPVKQESSVCRDVMLTCDIHPSGNGMAASEVQGSWGTGEQGCQG